MKNKNLIAIVASISLTMLFCCKPSLPENVFPSPEENIKTGKWGFSYNKNVIIKYKYDDADEFSSGLARVKLNGTWGFVDKKGKEVITPKFDFACNFTEEDFAKVALNGKYGFIDKTGKEIIPLMYDEISDFTEGIAKVALNEKYGVVDKTGKEIIPLMYDKIGDFTEDIAEVALNKKYGFIDRTGKEIIPLIYEEVGIFNKELVMVKQNDNYIFIDRNGETKTPSNGTLEIISINVPNSIVFKPAEGIEIRNTSLRVFLVSETTSYKANFIAIGNMILNGSESFFVFTNKSILRAIDFKVPVNFKANKIKFVVDNKNMSFDLDKSEWE